MNKDWLKENWFKLSILVILSITALGYLFLMQNKTQQDSNEKSLSSIEYKNLNVECREYGHKTYGGLDDKVIRYFEYSIPLETCVMEVQSFFTDGEIRVLIDIYNEETLIDYREWCRKVYEESKAIYTRDELSELCPTIYDFQNKRAEIFEKPNID